VRGERAGKVLEDQGRHGAHEIGARQPKIDRAKRRLMGGGGRKKWETG